MSVRYRPGNKIKFPWFSDINVIDMIEATIDHIEEDYYVCYFIFNGYKEQIWVSFDMPNISLISIS